MFSSPLLSEPLPGVPGEPKSVPDCVQVTVDFAALCPQQLQPPEDARETFRATDVDETDTDEMCEAIERGIDEDRLSDRKRFR